MYDKVLLYSYNYILDFSDDTYISTILCGLATVIIVNHKSIYS